MNPIISVIIPTYGRTTSLKCLLKKLLKQTVSNKMEILIVDQNQDNYIEQNIPKSILQHARLIKQPKPNVSNARNRGAIESLSTTLLFLDDDVEPDPDFIEKGLEIIETYQLECLTPVIYNANGKEAELNHRRQIITNHLSSTLKIITENITASLFFKKDSFLKSGGFDPVLFDYVRSTEDQEFFLRLPERGIPVYYDESLDIFHAEEIDGGCNLRESNFLENRKKFIKGWCFRYRTHNGAPHQLSVKNLIDISKAAFLNKKLAKRGLVQNLKLIQFTFQGILDSREQIKNFKQHYTGVKDVNHFSLLKYYN